MSWSPFSSLSHARTAGATLARLHQAAADFPVAARSPGVLTTSCEVITAADPLAAVTLILAQRPGLARYLNERRWQQDIARHHLPAIGRAAPLLKKLPRQWGHGDWHPSNLTWTSATADADVAAVLDFGLANRTFAVHDLATAIERSTVGWLDLPGSGRADADHDAIDALLDGYETVRPLNRPRPPPSLRCCPSSISNTRYPRSSTSSMWCGPAATRTSPTTPTWRTTPAGLRDPKDRRCSNTCVGER